MKSLADAVGLRDRMIQLLEQASAIGDRDKPPRAAAPDRRRRQLHRHRGRRRASTNTCSDAAEFYPQRRQEADIRMTVLNRGDTLLKALDEKLGEYALQAPDGTRAWRSRLNSQRVGRPSARPSVELKDGTKTPRPHRHLVRRHPARPRRSSSSTSPVDKHGYILCDARPARQGPRQRLGAWATRRSTPTPRGPPTRRPPRRRCGRGSSAPRTSCGCSADEPTETGGVR